jgi:hypothetical protein
VLTLKISQELKTETVIVSPGDSTYVRLSAQIYNEVNDYEKLKSVPNLAKEP